ncbi:energy transducer TonB [Oceanicaulis sp. LC35]|uniref:energy transducer TonB n=1 Tax=Oceanicaulis sp. LC35 TaxID=3349635 RepID=UPI003F82FEDB
MTSMTVTPTTAASPQGHAISTAARWITAGSLAVIITFALFVLMKVLIHVEVIVLPEPAERETFTLSENVRPHTVTRPDRPQRVDVEPLPVTPPIDRSSTEIPSEDGFTYATTPVTPEPVIDTGMEGVTLAPSPLAIRIPPVYPARELDRGITGQCTIRYDILASGATVNLQVTECDSTGFARATIAAVERWRHQTVQDVDPNRIVNRGVQTTLVFDLED